jgi:uncharacterized membrane protein
MLITKKHVISWFLLSLFAFALVVSGPAQADNSLVDSQEGLNKVATVYGNSAQQDIRVTVARIINVVLTLLGVIFVVLAILAGFKYMTAAGSEEKTKEAMDTLRTAIIGLIIILMAWAITRYTIQILNKTVSNAADYTNYNPNF